MQNKLFLKVADICELLEVKQTSAYEIIGNLNKELEEQGYLTLRGKQVRPVKEEFYWNLGALWCNINIKCCRFGRGMAQKSD